jgi:predicted membrane protein
MFMNFSGRQMVIFLTVIAPLLFLLAALFIEPNIWVMMLSIIWLGVGLMMLYIPKSED